MAHYLSELNGIVDFSVSGDPFFEQLGLADSKLKNTLAFLDDSKYVETINNNPNIVAVIVSKELKDLIDRRVIAIESNDPRFDFFTVHNHLATKNYREVETVIHASAKISVRAFVAPNNVMIGADVVVEPNAVILADVIIGSRCIVRAGAVIGSEGFEVKRTSKGLLPVFHDGRVVIGEGVEIGANTTIDKGIFGKDTQIGNFTKIDNLVHIAHNVKIGKNCLLVTKCCLLGSVTVGNDVWVGPATTIMNGCTIGHRAEVTIGTIVTKDVKEDTRVVGKLGFSKLMTY